VHTQIHRYSYIRTHFYSPSLPFELLFPFDPASITKITNVMLDQDDERDEHQDRDDDDDDDDDDTI
jgi:hypothetical protein